MKKGTCQIDTWETLKEHIKKQFYPEHVKHDARKKIKEL